MLAALMVGGVVFFAGVIMLLIRPNYAAASVTSVGCFLLSLFGSLEPLTWDITRAAAVFAATVFIVLAGLTFVFGNPFKNR